MTSTPLYNALLAHKKLNRASFHTPGHKNSSAILPKNLFELDFTELPDTDSLYEANTAIRASEELAAKLYGANGTLFSAGGCTLCIQTMLKLAVPFGGKVIASRMIHKSAVNTLALLNADIKWLIPKFSKDTHHFVQIDTKDIEKALNEAPKASCVYITSPDYFGNMADIKAIAKLCKKHNVPLLVDNAHGSHLKFLSKDMHPITLGADLVADSAHKTLPVLTGGAMLHIANKAYSETFKDTMAIFGSTSPSYPILTSLDIAISWLSKNAKKAYLKLEEDVSEINAAAKKRGLIDENSKVDPTRLALHTAKLGFSGDEAAEYFRENGIEPELSNRDAVVFIATPMNSDEDLGKLLYAVKKIPQKTPKQNNDTPIFEAPIVKKSLHEALFSESTTVSTTDSHGRISASTVSPCPPGIPILVPGETVTENSIKNLLHYGIHSINVLK